MWHEWEAMGGRGGGGQSGNRAGKVQISPGPTCRLWDGALEKEASLRARAQDDCNVGYGPLLPSFSYVLTLPPLLLFLHLLSLHSRYITLNSSAFVISHQAHAAPCPLDERRRREDEEAERRESRMVGAGDERARCGALN